MSIIVPNDPKKQRTELDLAPLPHLKPVEQLYDLEQLQEDYIIEQQQLLGKGNSYLKPFADAALPSSGAAQQSVRAPRQAPPSIVLLDTQAALLNATSVLKTAIAAARQVTDERMRCMELPPMVILSFLDTLHDLLHARIESLTHAEQLVHTYLAQLYEKTLGFTNLLDDFPNELIRLLTKIKSATGQQPLSLVNSVSNLERHADRYFLERLRLNPALFPDASPYFRTCSLDYVEVMALDTTHPSDFDKYRGFNHFKISDDTGALSGILKNSSQKNKLGLHLLKLKFKNYISGRVGVFLDGAHGFVVGKAFSGLTQVIHCITPATNADSAKQSPIFPRESVYIPVGTSDGRGIMFLAVDPHTIPFCASNGISVWFETRENAFNSKIQDFDIVVYDSERMVKLRYNLRDIGQGPSVSDIMLFLKESFDDTKKRTTPPWFHLNMLNCTMTNLTNNPIAVDQAVVIQILLAGLAAAFKGFGDPSQIAAMVFLKNTRPQMFEHWDFLTCDRLSALNAYMQGCVSELVYGTTIEIFIPLDTSVALTEQEQSVIDAERAKDEERIKQSNDTARMLVLIAQIEGPSIEEAIIPFVTRVPLLVAELTTLKGRLTASLTASLTENVRLSRVNPGAPCEVAVRALASVEVFELLRLVDCCIATSVGINLELIKTNWAALQNFAETSQQSPEESVTQHLTQLNSFNDHLLLLFNGKNAKNIGGYAAIVDMLKKAAGVEYFKRRQTFAPFGFNGSMYGGLFASLTKLTIDAKTTNIRFKTQFLQDITNPGLYKELEYIIIRFSELNIKNDPLDNLLKKLREIKEITEISTLDVILQDVHMLCILLNDEMNTKLSGSVKELGCRAMDAGNMGGKALGAGNLGGGRKRTIMKGGTPGSFELEELHIIYHNFSSQIYSLFRTDIFKNYFDNLSVGDMINNIDANTSMYENLQFIDIIYSRFIVIVSRYVNSLMDMELSFLYDYNYEYDLNSFVLIEIVFGLLQNLVIHSEIIGNPILELFQDKPDIHTAINSALQKEPKIDTSNKVIVFKHLLVNLLALSLVINPYRGDMIKVSDEFVSVNPGLFKTHTITSDQLIDVVGDLLGVRNVLLSQFDLLPPVDSLVVVMPTATATQFSTSGKDQAQYASKLGYNPDDLSQESSQPRPNSGSLVDNHKVASTSIGRGEDAARRAGSSTRTRRKLRRNHRRTQYTNKHKRSSKNTKHNTLKHRKSYRKHKDTVKRRKSRRHHQ